MPTTEYHYIGLENPLNIIIISQEAKDSLR
jgi:hypothetical protein